MSNALDKLDFCFYILHTFLVNNRELAYKPFVKGTFL